MFKIYIVAAVWWFSSLSIQIFRGKNTEISAGLCNKCVRQEDFLTVSIYEGTEKVGGIMGRDSIQQLEMHV